MKILGAVSASAFTVLLLLGSVAQGNLLKCATGDMFYVSWIYELALKAEHRFWSPDHPLGPNGKICKAYPFTDPSAYTGTTHHHLVQVCVGIEYFILYQWYHDKWIECELLNNNPQ
ncbi:BgTH12-01404 [Blumeria graminis f. sp. triticale]|uniref:BgtE-20045 n=3 Tax=Blumeria graminis TaxID=34373 RepID=A0A9X9MFB2_BLUGR|nr:BgTH12-01404 [Blumeria graminis f. sp. triticale]VDB83552.1 BgtE-20045 [Blumeria graminis f. sp. tritici]